MCDKNVRCETATTFFGPPAYKGRWRPTFFGLPAFKTGGLRLEETGGLDIFFGPPALTKKFYRRLFLFFFSCAVIIDVSLNVKDRTTELPEAHYFGHLRIGGPRKLSVPMMSYEVFNFKLV